jgi:hypothetical protein
MSRAIYLDGLTDGVKFTLRPDVSLIAKIMDLSQKYENTAYKWTLDGKTLIEVLKEFSVGAEVIQNINPKNEYLLTAFD